MSPDTTDRESRLDDLIASYLERIAAGNPTPVEEWLRQYPEFRIELAEFFADRQRIEHVAAPLRSIVPTSLACDGRALGDFRLLCELGRGGMGVVYEAEQISLGRRVAVKVLPFAAMLDDRQLLRFKNEARAAALLKHPHIVSVHAVGCERGTHFYVMELVDGRSLAELKERTAEVELATRNAELRIAEAGELSTPNSNAQVPGVSPDTIRAADATTQRGADRFRSIARLGIQASEALSYAHANGVIHRDIKPSNLLLDARGELWITDFGLARIQGAGELTMTGDVLGTLRYMSPEQLSGTQVVDERTDVYSLGLTLYELLAGRPAFTEPAREKLIQQVLLEEPPPPRRLDAHVPRDLETIVLKAIAKERELRYQSASDLTEDLQRFLESRPIRARRTTSLQRLRYWAQRKPAVAALAATVVMAMALGIAGTSHGWLTASRRAEEYRALLYRADMATALEAWHIGDARKVQELLVRHIPVDGETDLRGFEWYCLWRTVSDAGAERIFHHNQPVVQLAFLGDGRRLAARMLRGEFRILNVEDGTSGRPTAEEFATALPPPFHGGHENWAYRFRLGDTAEAIDRNDAAAAMYDLAQKLGIYGGFVSPAGDLVACGTYTDTVHLVELPSLNVRAEMKGHVGIILDMAFSPDGAVLATAGRDGKAILWNTADGQRLHTIPAHTNTCASVTFSPDGRWLATNGRDECVRIWDATTHAEVHRLETPGDTNSLAFAPDGNYLAGAGNASVIYVWRVDDWKLLQTYKGHSGSIRALRFSPDGKRLASGAGDGDVRIWRVDEPSPDAPWFALADEARALAFHPQKDLLASGSWDGSVRLWDVRRRALHAELYRSGDRVLSVAFNASGELLAAGGDADTISVFDTADGRLRCRLNLQGGSLAFTPAGDLIGTLDKQFYFWRRSQLVASKDVVDPALKFDGQFFPIAVAVNRNGTRLLLGNADSTEVELRDLPTLTLVTTNGEHNQRVLAAAASPREDLFATGSADGTVRLWEDHHLACRCILRGHSNYVIGLAFSPSEDILASASLDGTVRLWDTRTGAERAAFTGHTIGASSVAFSRNGDMLATGDLKGNIRLFVTASPDNVAHDLAAMSLENITVSTGNSQSARGP